LYLETASLAFQLHSPSTRSVSADSTHDSPFPRSIGRWRAFSSFNCFTLTRNGKSIRYCKHQHKFGVKWAYTITTRHKIFSERLLTAGADSLTVATFWGSSRGTSSCKMGNLIMRQSV
jgi:hypothetical protein